MTFDHGCPDVRYAVIDVETTGLEIGIHRVVECAIVEVDSAGAEIDAWSTLFAVPGDGELGATEIHGITRAMTTDAPCFASVSEAIVRRLAGRVLVGHVVEFDLGHLGAEFTRAGVAVPLLDGVAICTREIVKQRLPEGPRSLRACCDRLGLVYDGAHSALGDARATAAVFGALRLRFGDCGTAMAHQQSVSARWPEVAEPDSVARTRRRALAGTATIN